MKNKKAVRRIELICLLIVTIITVAVRFWKIAQIPPNVTGDEVNFLVESLRITLNKGKGFFALCEPGQQPCFNDYLTALPLKILGYQNAVLAIRLPNLILTTIMIFPFFFILKKRFSTLVSLLSTLLFATGYWNLNFSRSAWNPAQLNFYLLIFIFLYEKWLYGRKHLYLTLAGIFSGLMFYGYHAGKYFLIIFFFYCIFSLILSLAKKKEIIFSFLFIATITFIMALPQLNFIIRNKNLFLLRPRVVSIFSIKDYPSYHQSKNFGDVMKYQFDKSLRGVLFLDKVDISDIENLRYLPNGSPLVDLITRSLVLFGLFLVLTKFHAFSLSPWVYSSFLVNIFLISIWTTEPPNSNRLIMMMPIYYFLLGLSLEYLTKKAKLNLLIILLCAVITIYNLSVYFNWANERGLSLVRQPALEYEDVATWIKLQIPVSYRSPIEVVRIEHDFLINWR